ncbi:MAG: MFS transporter [Chloroflexi bacterium]|nr:MFS transporter [Chloroflexota bacterium]
MSSERTRPEDSAYRRRINAWALYDWANSAFATTILASLLPIYYSTVAGATLPSEATATAYWSLTISLSLFIVAILSPIMGTVSDVMRSKKRFLAIFIGAGVVGAGLLIFVNTGDWLLASLFFVLGRIGFGGSLVFYDALLPHIARAEDRDWVSTRGYALGYMGGGILLAINVAMFWFIPDSLFENAGVRLSFLSVAIWWALFSLPILRQVPEPPSVTVALRRGETVIGVSLRRLRDTFRNLTRYRELFKYLVAFLIYNDAIGTIIAIAAIYGAELGFGTIELVLAILLVQFAGIPFSIIFGRLPAHNDERAPFYLAFILINAIALPLLALALVSALPDNITGVPPVPYVTDGDYVGEGIYRVGGAPFAASGAWHDLSVSGDDLIGDGLAGRLTALLAGRPDDLNYRITDEENASQTLAFNGKAIELEYRSSPDGGVIAFRLDGEVLTEAAVNGGDSAALDPVTVDTANDTVRYGETFTLELDEPGLRNLTIVNVTDQSESAPPKTIALGQIEVQPAARVSSLPTIIGIIAAFELIALLVAWLIRSRFVTLSNWLDTRRCILLSLLVYSIIACWGFFLNATLEFWMLALMVALVQGGSQALSRSLYASLCPKAKSGEFFGFYSIMEKFASIIGPLIFAFAAIVLGSSRPAILSLILLFLLGGYLLSRVDVEAGQRVAREEDAAHGHASE